MANAVLDSFSDVIGLWPSRTELATDVSVPYGVVKQWDRRDSIPPEHWQAVIDAAQRRGYHAITPDLLTRLAGRRRPATQSAGAAA